MKLIMSLLEKYLMPFSNKITSNKLLNAIKDACILTSPFTVVGSLAGLVSQRQIIGLENGESHWMVF